MQSTPPLPVAARSLMLGTGACAARSLPRRREHVWTEAACRWSDCWLGRVIVQIIVPALSESASGGASRRTRTKVRARLPRWT